MSSLRPQRILIALAFLALCVLALPAHAGLIARYNFEDDSSPAALGTDNSGNGNHLTAVGALTGVPGIDGGTAVNVTPGYLWSNDSVFQPSTSSNPGEFATAFWYKRDSNASGVPVGRGDPANIGSDPGKGYAVFIDDEDTFSLMQLTRIYDPTGSNPATHSTPLPGTDESVFQHVVIQRRAGQLEMFLNGGTLNGGLQFTVADSDATITSVDTSLSFSVGGANIDSAGVNGGVGPLGITGAPDSFDFEGAIDDLRVFDMGLTPEEISVIFNDGEPPGGGGPGGVPEPSSMILLGLGLLGLSRVRRRRRR